MAEPTKMTAGQRAYEAKRAAKAGVSLDRWLETKARDQAAAEKARQKSAEPPKPAKKPGLIARLIDRAHKPI